MVNRNETSAVSTRDALVWFAWFCVSFGGFLVAERLPTHWLPLPAGFAWQVLAFAGGGELYARGRPDLLARGRLFALAAAVVYLVSLAVVKDPSLAHEVWPVCILGALLTAEIATTFLDVGAVGRARMRGEEVRQVPASLRWYVLAASASWLLVPLLQRLLLSWFGVSLR